MVFSNAHTTYTFGEKIVKHRKPKKEKNTNGGDYEKQMLGGLAKVLQAKHKLLTKVPLLTCKIYKYGERGSGFTIMDEPQDFDKLLDECLRSGVLFEDPTFPANNSSVFPNEESPINIKWKRPHEIVQSPQFEVEGYSRFDIKQGNLSDCWLLAAIVNLTLYPNIFHNVVPENQSFTDRYAGIFHFRFWYFGRWIDIVVDDRLPVNNNGQLRFLRSTANNEFWTALLEKAYAKLYGSYGALTKGFSTAAMTDFTGGITELFFVQKMEPGKLFYILLTAFQRNSLMTCSIYSNEENIELPEGLLEDHVYSITSVNTFEIESPEGLLNIQMIRLCNPWGNAEEWNGPYADNSPEWNRISEQKRTEIGLVFEADGEFWMPFSHFMKYFSAIEICNLKPDSFTEEELHKMGKTMWHMNMFEGEWVTGVTAGGCRNYLDTFILNPQYRVQLVQPDDDGEEKLCTLIVFIIKRSKTFKIEDHVGLALYALKNSEELLPTPLNKEFFANNVNLNASGSFFSKVRQYSYRFKLPLGTYCIIPTTYLPHIEGEFQLYVYTEKKCQMEENDEEVGLNESQKQKIPCCDEDLDKHKQREFFDKLAGEDKEVDWFELKGLLDFVMKQELGQDGFSKDICRSMIAMMDYDYSGKLGYEEYKKLWAGITKWRNIFKMYEKNNVIKGMQLRQALKDAGFNLNNRILNILVHRYGNHSGDITFDDFIMCSVRLKTMFETFILKDINNLGVATFTLEEWLQKAVYS